MLRRFLVFLALCTLAFPDFAFAKSWSFDRWNVSLDVQPDSSVLVREEQTLVFEGPFTWVTRDLPASKGILYSDIQVFDESGQLLSGDAVDITNRQSSASIRLNFDLADTTKTWTFSYRAWNAIGFFDDHDELYWNAVSVDREVPITDAVVTLTLPRPLVSTNDWQQRLFLGPTGSTDESTTYEVVDMRSVRFSAHNLFPSENMTIVAGWPKGFVTETIRKRTHTAMDHFRFFGGVLFLFSPLPVFLFLHRRWRIHGKDPKGRGTIVPQYDPPDKSPPAVVGVLIDERVDAKELPATIVDLAVRGHLTIEETREGFLKRRSFRFHRKRHADAPLLEYERLLLDSLFVEGDIVELNDLKNKFYKYVKDINDMMYDATVSQGYFAENPEKVRNKNLLVLGGIFVVFVALWALLHTNFEPTDLYSFLGMAGLVLGLGIDGVLVFAFGKNMPRRTPKGVAAKEWAEGFKLYLHTAERYRVAAMTPKTFERFLPYAMIFGVEKEWARSFEPILRQPPDWYTGYNIGAFSALAFTSDLSKSMSTTIGQVLGSSPSSNSGFGGGGGAGGGGGGGGSGAG